MRFKIKLKITNLPIERVATDTATILNKLLGNNHKWHDINPKPYTCSLIRGGELNNGKFTFTNGAYFYINTEDEEVINSLLNNPDIEFDIENNKTFSGYNLLSVKNIVYNTNGKENWITDENKNNFIQYVKQKYFVDIEIYKIKNHHILYKERSRRPVSDLLIKCNGKNVKNLFESGIGGSCSIGFGFVETINKK